VLNKKFNIPFFRLFYIGLFPDKSLDIRSKKEILFIYPLIEILILCSLFLAYIRFDSLEQFIALSFFVSLIFALGISDLTAYVLPDNLNFSLILIGLMVSFFNFGFPFIDFKTSISSIFLLIIPSLITYFISRKFVKKRFIGIGDLKLFVAISAWFGIVGLCFISIISCVIIISFSAINLVKKSLFSTDIKLINRAYPFGFFVLISSLIYLFFRGYFYDLLLV